MIPYSKRKSTSRLDALLAIAVFASLFLLYWWTLLPGLGGTEDTAKFQYIGPSLGTPHDPGYPVYMVLTYLWAKLPIGTLAYRINLLSAVCGAAAAALVFLAQRRLAVHPWIAVAASIGLGVGKTFWQHSVFAEVYTLTAALMAAAFLAILKWDATRRTWWLYVSVGFACLAFGVHEIVAGAVPALVLFVLATLRWRPPARVLVVCALIVTAGVAQYTYVWIRTIQKAEFLEARVDSLTDFWNMLRAKEFEGITFSESPRVVVTRRVPTVAGALAGEVGPIAAAFAVLGCGVLLIRRTRLGILFGFSIVGIVFLLANLGDVAVGAILLPSAVPAWLLAGVGLETVRGWLGRIAPGWLSVGIAGCLVTAVPVTHVARNFAFNNHRHDTYHTDYFCALFQSLPVRAGFIDEEYTLNSMLRYQAYVTGRRNVSIGVPDDPAAIGRLKDEGARVLAFDRGRAALEGLVVFRPVTLAGLAPLDMEREPLFEVEALNAPERCTTLPDNQWTTLADPGRDGRLVGRLDHSQQASTRWQIYFGSTIALPVQIGDRSTGSAIEPLVDHFTRRPDSRLALEKFLRGDGLRDAGPLLAAAAVTRVDMVVDSDDPFRFFHLELGGRPAVAIARVISRLSANAQVRVCGVPVVRVRRIDVSHDKPGASQ